ncbi:lipolytic enzyme [Mycena pura]|uniref:Lipolytic enzyme n=1 Tax=Mycena pura TaxID=153505 RepID=A0AAD6YVE5_9AGAR|nr:lipolytic enzyme [Mycena pura]
MRFSILFGLCVAARLAYAQSPEWGQCGGMEWTGPTTCVSGTVCVVQNPFYSQCLPGPDTTPPSTTTVTTPKASSTTATQTTSAPTSTSTTTGLNIRLLPLGDSITFGFTSSDGNGYRSALHDMLQPGNTVDFIGSISSGTMADNQNEGHVGAIIEQIAQAATNPAALPARPNVVLLMAGTNDLLDGISAGAPAQLATLVDAIFAACPDAALVVAALTPLNTAAGQSTLVATYNAAVAQLVNARQAAGHHILLASMASVLVSDLVDGIHPTDAGYIKMANAWFPVIEQAAKNGWIGKPVAV